MKSIKMALMAGAAVAVSAAAAHADELTDLKAQVEALNARVAAMETAPSVPAGYQLLAISKGEAAQIPGLGSSDRDRVTTDRATVITVMPTADAPAGTTISWSGYVKAGIVYSGTDVQETRKAYRENQSEDGWVRDTDTAARAWEDNARSNDWNDWDVKARGQLRVVATTDTAVGEVGVELKLRGDFNGNGTGDVYMKTAWGYWAMTPELTLGGGYAGSLGNIGYGYDGACTCYFTDNGDVGFDPGDTTQMRLSYASGPFSMAVALEDAGANNAFGQDNYAQGWDRLGAAGEIKYSGDSFSGEISGVYRAVDSDYFIDNVDSLWQVGAGVGFNLGDMASISLAAALGAGPVQLVNNGGDVTGGLPLYNQWWGVSGLASANLSDTVHAEVAAGYKHREGDDFTGPSRSLGVLDVDGFNYDTYSFLGGVYYTPVDQLTIGVEGEWYTQQWDTAAFTTTGFPHKYEQDIQRDNWTVDLVSVWRF